MKEKNKTRNIVIMIILVIMYMVVFMFMGPWKNEAISTYMGVLSALQLLITVGIVVTNRKRGFLVACILCALSVSSAATAMIRSHSNGSLPGIFTPVINIIEMAIILTYMLTSDKQKKELEEQYEKISDSSRIIQEQNDALKAITYTDRMTGIPNRQYFTQQIDEAIRLNMPFTLIYADVDNFKSINDTYGPKVGDAALIAYAERVSSYCGRKYKFARVAGDEFGILLTGEMTEADVMNMIEQLRKMFMDPINAMGTPIAVTMSYGIVAHPRDGRDTELLLDSAIMAVYNAKANGKDRPCFFSPSN